MEIPEMASVIADYAKKYNGKSKTGIERLCNDYCKRNGVTKDFWENGSPVPLFAADSV
jgi:hypothetical protein